MAQWVKGSLGKHEWLGLSLYKSCSWGQQWGTDRDRRIPGSSEASQPGARAADQRLSQIRGKAKTDT